MNTAVVCKTMNRGFIGFEKDEVTYNIARARVDGTAPLEKAEQGKFMLQVLKGD